MRSLLHMLVSLLFFTYAGSVRADDRGHAYVSVSGFSSPHDRGAMFTVGFPFDRTARSIGDSGRTPSTQPPLVLTSRLARQAVLAAWRAAGIGIDDRRIDDMTSRAHWSALLPEMRLRAIRWDDERLYSYSTEDRTSDQTGAKLGLEARLTWRLDRLVYADDEPAFERIRMERQETRTRVAQRVLEALFHWQRALIELHACVPGMLEEVEASSRVAEAEAALDVLTAGWFSQRGGAKP